MCPRDDDVRMAEESLCLRTRSLGTVRSAAIDVNQGFRVLSVRRSLENFTSRVPVAAGIVHAVSGSFITAANEPLARADEQPEHQCKGKAYRRTVFSAQPWPPPRHRGNRLSGSLLRAAMQGKVHHCGST